MREVSAWERCPFERGFCLREVSAWERCALEGDVCLIDVCFKEMTP